MKKSVLLVGVLVAVMLFFSLNLVYADFSLGKLLGTNGSNVGYDINTEYGPRSVLSGTINLSISDENFDSLLSVNFDGDYDDEIILRDFLKFANVDYSCTTVACGMEYKTTGSGASTKTINLNAGESKIVGFKITGEEISDIDKFSLNIASTALSSCTLPLKVDITNNGEYDWVSHESTAQQCSADNTGYGCYYVSQSTSYSDVVSTPYCTNIKVPIAPKLFVGADLTSIGDPSNANFNVSVEYEDGRYESCKFSVSNSGEAGCIINASLIKEETVRVCLSTLDNSDVNEYKVGKETNSPCGEDSGGNPADYSIFARPMSYSAITNFDLTSELAYNLNYLLYDTNTIEESMEYYLDNVYNGDCTNGCVIPINLTSGVSQTVTLSGLDFIFNAPDPETILNGEIYSLSGGASVINMGYKVLDLSKAGLIVPKDYGIYDAELSLDGEEILTTEIEVSEVPVVDLLYPQKVPAGIDVVFRAYVSGSNITKYTWDFGDNSSEQETSKNTIVYKYSDLGTFIVTITAESSKGISSPEKFSVNIVSPQQYMGDIFRESQEDIDFVRTKVNSYPGWIKTYFTTKLELDKKESELKKLKIEFDGAGGMASSYVAILNSLEALDIPADLIKRNQGSVQFLVDKELVDVSVLESFGAGTSKKGVNYGDAIFEWFVKSMTVLVNEEVYYVLVDKIEQPIASEINFIITSKIPLEDIYFIINKVSTDVSLEDSSLSPKSVGTSTGILFPSLGTNKKVNFLLPGEIGILDLPIYFSPGLSKLAAFEGLITDACNNNRVCESEETWRTCRADCKPWGLILLWLFILFLIAFATYIALQEWYKRKYEDHLFKDKNELFNLINFIDNAEKQEMSRNQIFKNLKEKGWEDEQILYALRKYKGVRVGLWEVPLFKFVEKMQIKKEVEKRRQQGQTGRIAPIPGARAPSKLLQLKQPSEILQRPGQPMQKQMGKQQEPEKKGFAKFWDKYGIKLKKKEKGNLITASSKPAIQNQNINKPNLTSKNINK